MKPDLLRCKRKGFRLFAEALFTLSGTVTTVVILLIILFLFKEGAGLFRSNEVEKGYSLCVHASSPVERLSPAQIKQIFDYETEWIPFRLEDLFDRYSEEELGKDYALLPGKLGEEITKEPKLVAFVPTQYVPTGLPTVRVLPGSRIGWLRFFGGKEWMPTATPAPLFGVLPLLLGTLWVSLFAILIALPLGLGATVYLSELAGEKMRRLLKPAIELLAGIPSVVYGFFGLVVLVPFLQRTGGLPVGETALAGSLILAIMALPTIITVAEDAMRNTPKALREASLALGATRWQTIYRVVFPASVSGISAAIVLGIGRAVGETMAVLMVTGNAAVMPSSLLEPVRTIPATIAAELGEAPAGGAHYQALFMLGCILFLITLLISTAAEIISGKSFYNKKGI
ncbi:MAG: phosphate ABC transporter permease subunit PstC [Dysgonamonadaceae bacterium]|jgi:phosphate transport system permease protein|nr:phosphate ABC transporter permease subunit PstC [Dysgonamonadaceae bacterium]